MNKTELMTNMSRTFYKGVFKLKKHSPEILVVAGVIGTVVSTVMACKATTKIDSVLDDSKQKIERIHETIDNPETAKKYLEKTGEEYTLEDQKKDLAITYTQTGLQLAKLYAPAVAVGALSITGILMSHRIMTKRNVALAAAYTAIDKGFKDYRSRVIERWGEAIDRELRYNIKAEEVQETVVNEDGTEETVTRTIRVIDPTRDVSPYARFFEEYTRDDKGNVIKNMYWDKSNLYNLTFLKQTQSHANDLLRAKGFMYLNEVYEMLNLPRTKEGQIVGWVYDPEKNDRGDNYIDFGLYTDPTSYSDFIYENDPAILLDFNVDGNIWDLM